jgi:hypothetical protein
LPDHADTPRGRQIVTSRHGQPDLAPSPNVTRHKIRARATHREHGHGGAVRASDKIVNINLGKNRCRNSAPNRPSPRRVTAPECHALGRCCFASWARCAWAWSMHEQFIGLRHERPGPTSAISTRMSSIRTGTVPSRAGEHQRIAQAVPPGLFAQGANIRASDAAAPVKLLPSQQQAGRLGTGDPRELPGGQLLGTRHRYCRLAGLADGLRRGSQQPGAGGQCDLALKIVQGWARPSSPAR